MTCRRHSESPAGASPGDSDSRELVVFAGATAWDDNRMLDQHVAERLAAYGPVLYVDPAMSLLTPLRNPRLRSALGQPRLRLIAADLFRLSPIVPPGISRPGLRAAATNQRRRAIRLAVHRMGRPVRAVVTTSLDNVFGACAEALHVLYATDDLVAGGGLMGMSSRYLSRCERSISRRADLVVTCSPSLQEKWSRLGHQPVYVPNGVDDALFADTDKAPLPPDVHLPAPIVGFVGHLSDRIDLTLLEAVATTGVSLLLVGPRQRSFAIERIERLLARPNVQWVGPKEFHSLPSYMRLIDVGLVPYGDTAFNRGSFPMKTLEYLAAGRGVVATDLPSVRWLDTDLLAVASSPQAFVDAVLAELVRARDARLTARRQAFAAEHSWDRRVASFARVLDMAPAGDVSRSATLDSIATSEPCQRLASPPPSSTRREGASDMGVGDRCPLSLSFRSRGDSCHY